MPWGQKAPVPDIVRQCMGKERLAQEWQAAGKAKRLGYQGVTN